MPVSSSIHNPHREGLQQRSLEEQDSKMVVGKVLRTTPNDITSTASPTLLHAPIKSEKVGFNPVQVIDVLKSPSITASANKALKSKSGTTSSSTSSNGTTNTGWGTTTVFGNVKPGAKGKHCKSPLDLTPIRASSASIKKKGILGDKEVNVMSNRRGSVDLETFFGTKLQTSSKAYVAPHRRVDAPIQQIVKLSSFNQTGLPEPEDHFYSQISPLSLNQNTNNNLSRTRSNSYSFTPPSSTTASPISYRTRRSFHDTSPPFSPPASLISRQIYDDPDNHKHPDPIKEEEYASESEADDEGEDDVFSSPSSPRSFEEHDTDDRVQYAAASRIIFGDPSSSASATVSEFSAASTVSHFEPDVCTSCGSPAVPSFVALIPCDHLLCHQCLNALINSAAHKPPRPMDCFSCGVLVESFGPAFAGHGGMVDALRATLSEISVQEPRRGFGSRGRAAGKENDTADESDFSRSSSHTSTLYSSHSITSAITQPLVTTPKAKKTFASFARLQQKQESGLDSGVGTPDPAFVLSPVRHLDWSEEPMGTPRSSSHRKYATESPTVYLQDVYDQQSIAHTIPQAIDWPVLRLDNIPWDVTVAEIEEWLPADTLAPASKCVLAVHILCNRSDGRTLNQCYIEASSIHSARQIVRTHNGRKIRNRPVHITLSGQGDFMSTIFPSWMPGFDGVDLPIGGPIAPLIMQTELTGLLALCKLDSNHASKVQERPFFNIVTLLQKFPWHQPNTYNSKQIVRLYNTSLAAVEILLAVRHQIPDWNNILKTIVDACTSCPVFRPAQKAKILQAAGLQLTTRSDDEHAPVSVAGVFSFSPIALRESFVTVEVKNAADGVIVDSSPEVSPTPSRTLHSSPTIERSAIPLVGFASQSRGSSSTSAIVPVARKRRISSISRHLGVDASIIEAVAVQLGFESSA